MSCFCKTWACIWLCALLPSLCWANDSLPALMQRPLTASLQRVHLRPAPQSELQLARGTTSNKRLRASVRLVPRLLQGTARRSALQQLVLNRVDLQAALSLRLEAKPLSREFATFDNLRTFSTRLLRLAGIIKPADLSGKGPITRLEPLLSFSRVGANVHGYF